MSTKGDGCIGTKREREIQVAHEELAPQALPPPRHPGIHGGLWDRPPSSPQTLFPVCGRRQVHPIRRPTLLELQFVLQLLDPTDLPGLLAWRLLPLTLLPVQRWRTTDLSPPRVSVAGCTSQAAPAMISLPPVAKGMMPLPGLTGERARDLSRSFPCLCFLP